MASSNAAIDPKGEDFVPDEIPERLQDDQLIRYFRLRFHDREEFLWRLKDAKNATGVGNVDVHRIEKELERIERLKSTFAKSRENKATMDDFESSRAQWR